MKLLALFAVCLVAATSLLAAAEPASQAHNAAVVYWQAMAALPILTPEEQKTYDAALDADQISPEAKAVIAKHGTALKIMQRASLAKTCDWELNFEDGPATLLPHLAKLRDLARIAALRARLRFQEHDEAGAGQDLQMTFRAARHAAANPVLVSYLVGVSMERMATKPLTENLQRLDRNQLGEWAKFLTELPPAKTTVDCMEAEEEYFVGWLERQVAPELALPRETKIGPQVMAKMKAGDLLGSMKKEELEQLEASVATVGQLQDALAALHADYRRLIEIAKIPHATERTAKARALEEELAASKAAGDLKANIRIFSWHLMPSTGRVLEKANEQVIQRALLLLAIQGQRNGLESLKDLPKPGDGEFKAEAVKGGFVVEYRDPGEKTWQVLRVGKKVGD